MANLGKTRWSVTYTKHVNQKRKVYQDGFLEFHNSTNKIELYDDCQKLLCVKIAKEDEVIRSGETLAFNTYLVDIGDLEGGCKPMSNLNGQVRDNNVTEKAGLLRSKRKFSPVFGSGKSNLENKAPSSCLSPSQKVIREFKKHEMLKYGGSANSPDAAKPSNSDWQVLYTTQKTQKAKKYHDGFLRIASCGSQGRQATLYDLSRRVLDSKFLRKDEVVESGESLVFDGHLVDVGDPERGHKPPSDIKAQGKTFSAVNENLAPGSSNLQVNGLTDGKYTRREWHALYTNQITQKAKKYQSGFLTLASCGSSQQQATLLAEDGTILCRKFVKPSEDIMSNSTFRLPNYLVEVGEPHGSPEGEPPKLSFAESDEKPTSSPAVDSSDPGKSDPLDKPLHGEDENLTSSHRTPEMKDLTDEWHALYTNQITQKAKKYQSGFLTLASCGSFQLQATLVAEDGTVLSRKFLKLSENMRNGRSFQLPNYLVEVGEPRKSPEGEPPKVPSAEREEKSTFCPSVDSLELGKSDPADKHLHGEYPRNAFFGRKGKSMLHPSVSSGPGNRDPVDKPISGGEPPKDVSSGRVPKSTFLPIADRSESGNCDSVDKPLRCANDILSILRNAPTKQSSLPTKSIPMEQRHHSQLPDYNHPQFQNHVGRDVGDCDRERHDADNHTNRVLISEDSQSKFSAPSNFSIGGVNDFSVLNSHGEHTSMSTLKPFSSAKELHVKLEPQQPLPLDNSSNGHAEAFIESMFLKDATSPLCYDLPEELNTKTFAQPDEETKMDIGMTSFDVCNNTSEMDEVPSFDLRF